MFLSYPHDFRRKSGDYVIPPARPSVRPCVRMSCSATPPRVLHVQSSNFGIWLVYVCRCAQRSWNFAPPPGALGRGQKVKYTKNSITVSFFNILKQNFACILVNEKYKTYQTFFLILTPRGPPGGVGKEVIMGSNYVFFKYGLKWKVVIMWSHWTEKFAPRSPLGVGVGGGQKLSFSEHSRVAYQIECHDECSVLQAKILP